MSHFSTIDIHHTQIREAILTKLQMHHRGKHNAIIRERLLEWLQEYWPDMDDRAMRKVIETLRIKRVCSGNDGYYIAISKDEVDEAIAYFDKKAMPLLKAKTDIRRAYPEYYNGGQRELW